MGNFNKLTGFFLIPRKKGLSPLERLSLACDQKKTLSLTENIIIPAISKESSGILLLPLSVLPLEEFLVT